MTVSLISHCTFFLFPARFVSGLSNKLRAIAAAQSYWLFARDVRLRICRAGLVGIAAYSLEPAIDLCLCAPIALCVS